MNQMEIFKNPEFGSIRVIEENGKYLFSGTDVADRTRYLLGAAEVSEIDQNGNECSINLFTLERTIDYVNENLTVVSIGGELVPALRLI